VKRPYRNVAQTTFGRFNRAAGTRAVGFRNLGKNLTATVTPCPEAPQPKNAATRGPATWFYGPRTHCGIGLSCFVPFLNLLLFDDPKVVGNVPKVRQGCS
jgi:hypothetical protein